MKTKKYLALILAFCLIFALAAACGTPDPAPADPVTPDEPAPAEPATPDEPDAPPPEEEVDEGDSSSIPRDESLFFGGLAWGPLGSWNPLGTDHSNWAWDPNGGGSRTMVYETPYMYNALTAGYHPLLADGPFEWNADKTELTFSINPAAYWRDGTPVTAEDVAFTWEARGAYTANGNGGWEPYIQNVEAVDEMTVKLTAVTVPDGRPAFANQLEQYIVQEYVIQKSLLETIIDRNGGDVAAISVDTAADLVDVLGSGPYMPFFDDDTRLVLIRDDNYWGQDPSMWGSLPTPKYLVNLIFPDNAAILAALQAGDIDVSQSYINDVNLLWEQHGLPISTYISEPPYNLAANMPTVYFNLREAAHPAIKELELRQAIAYATDFDLILANAMTYQSPSFKDVPRSLMNPSAPEQAMYNNTPELDALRWDGAEVDRANQILDDSGKFPMGDDGWRTYDGEKMSFTASCPSGWDDWEKTLEMVAAAGASIGVEITTNFVSESEFYDHVTVDPTSGQFPIFMMWSESFSPSQPWGRARALMSSEYNDWTAHNWSGNWGHFANDRADELLWAIPLEQDMAAVREMYTELTEIYLSEIPSFSAMYRPDKFHTVYEGVWTGFTEEGDGRNVPPFNCLSGYAIADLFNLRLVG